MSEPIDPLDAELAALIDRERHAAVPDAALARVWSRVLESAVARPAGAEDRAAGADGTARHRDADHEGCAGSSAPRSGGWIALHAKKLIALAFIAGTAVGAAGHAIMRSAAVPGMGVEWTTAIPSSARVPSRAPDAPSSVPRAPAVDSPVTASHGPELARPTAPNIASAFRSPPLPSPPPPRGASSSPHAPGGDVLPSSLAAERALLDRARTSLARGDGAGALALLDEHTRRFQPAQLAEEREALAVQALAINGQYDEARARAAHFRATWLDSLFLPAVEATLSSIP